MSPSTGNPEDVFRKPSLGTYTCRVCGHHDRGGQPAFYGHWLREHYDPGPAGQL